MKKLLNRYAGIALLLFVVQLAGAFLVGASGEARWDPASGVESSEVPSPLIGGSAAVLVVALYLLFGWMLRIVAYIRMDREGYGSRTLWWVIAIGEGVYVLFNLAVLWLATEPIEDAGWALLFLIMGAAVTTVVSIVIVALAFWVTRRQTLHGLKEE